MHIVRYRDAAGGERVGARTPAGVIRLPIPSIEHLLSLHIADVQKIAANPAGEAEESFEILAPIAGRTEVWASGVTYLRSRDARVEESQHQDVYERVYDAVRPELFSKSVGWRVVTDGDPVGIRADSDSNIPEPELALVLNRFGERVGYLVSNDMSSRSIEGENPIYLPQAKIYAGSCALSNGIRPAWEVKPDDLGISIAVTRGSDVVFSGATSTSEMKRTFDEISSYLFRGDDFPYGVVLSTGTGVVPDLDFTLQEGDRIDIEIAEVGTLSNTVAVGKDAFSKEPIHA